MSLYTTFLVICTFLFICVDQIAPIKSLTLAHKRNSSLCSRLRDSVESEKAFKNKKTRGRGGETGRPPPPPLPSRARLIFALLV